MPLTLCKSWTETIQTSEFCLPKQSGFSEVSKFPGNPFKSALHGWGPRLLHPVQTCELVAWFQTSQNTDLNESCKLKSPRTTTSNYTKPTYGTSSSKRDFPVPSEQQNPPPVLMENAQFLYQCCQGHLWNTAASKGYFRAGREWGTLLWCIAPVGGGLNKNTLGMSLWFKLILRKQKHLFSLVSLQLHSKNLQLLQTAPFLCTPSISTYLLLLIYGAFCHNRDSNSHASVDRSLFDMRK